MVIDLRDEKEAAEAAEMKADIAAKMTSETRNMRAEMRARNQATRLMLSGSAAVDQLGNLQRRNPNMTPLIQEGIAKFNNARALVDRFKEINKQKEMQAHLKDKDDLIAREKRQKEESEPLDEYPFKTCECTTKLTKYELMYTGAVPTDTTIMNGGELVHEGTTMSEQSFEIEQLKTSTSLNITSGKATTMINLNCSLPVFIGQTYGDWKVFDAESENGKLCDRPSPRQLTNANNTAARNARNANGSEEPKKLTTHEHFSAMMLKLHGLAFNWDSAVKAPVLEIEAGKKLTPEQIAERDAKAKLFSDEAAANAEDAANMNKIPGPDSPTPAPVADLAGTVATEAPDPATVKLNREAAALAGAAQQADSTDDTPDEAQAQGKEQGIRELFELLDLSS